MADVITSTSNSRIKAVRKLHQVKHRRDAGLTIVEGPNGRDALVRTGTVPREFLVAEDDAASLDVADRIGVKPLLVTQDVLDAAADSKHTPGPVAVIGIPAPQPVRQHPTIGLVDIADPGNVGTIIRTAVGFGWDVAVVGSTADPWSPKAIRSAAGTTLDAHIARVDTPVMAAADVGLRSMALVVSGGDAPATTPEPAMLLVGSEAHGLDDDLVGACDTRITIGTAGVESLNAASAAAIAMYALTP